MNPRCVQPVKLGTLTYALANALSQTALLESHSTMKTANADALRKHADLASISSLKMECADASAFNKNAICHCTIYH